MLKLSIWYLWHTFINAIKRAWKIFLAFVLIGFVIGIIVVVGIVFASKFDESSSKDEDGSQTMVEISDTDEGEKLYSPEEYQSKKPIELVRTTDGFYLFENGTYNKVGDLILDAIVTMVVMLFITLAVMSGAKNGASIFTMPDVNFLFSSPNRPQSILLFKMIGQIGTALIGAFYMLGQMSNLRKKASLSGALMVLVCYAVLQIMSNFMSIFVYVALQNHKGIKEKISKYGMLLMLSHVIIAAIIYFIGRTSVFTALHLVFSSIGSNLFPLIGWLKASGIYALNNRLGMSVIMLLASLAGTFVLALFTWRIPCDFYEDALESATEKQQELAAMENKQAGGSKFGVKHEGKRQEKLWEKRRNKTIDFQGFDGAKVFFGKTLLTRKRMHPLNGLWSTTASTYFCGVLGLLFAMTVLFKINNPLILSTGATIAIIILMFLRSFVNPLQMDLGQNFIYMIPERPVKLLGWGMIGQVVDGALDLLPACILMIFFAKSPLLVLSLYLLMLSEHILFGTTALLVSLVITNYMPVVITRTLQIIIRMIPFGPVVAIFAVGLFTDHSILTTIICAVINLGASALAFLPCPYHLHSGKR